MDAPADAAASEDGEVSASASSCAASQQQRRVRLEVNDEMSQAALLSAGADIKRLQATHKVALEAAPFGEEQARACAFVNGHDHRQ